jgi:hypothetical protein
MLVGQEERILFAGIRSRYGSLGLSSCRLFLVAPYSYDSALNSGTVLLACSYGKTVVCPDIAGVRDIQAESNCLYAYHYADNAEHAGRLHEALARALADFRSGTIAEKESRALDYMHRNSWDANRSKWCSLFKR